MRYFAGWGAAVGLEPEDLRQMARVAVLEAALSHRGGRAKLKTWVNRTIRWRLTEALQGSERPEEPLDEPSDVVNGQNPEELVERLQIVRWVRRAVDGLDVRQRAIVACRLRGESMREIGMSLGISKTRAHQEVTFALEVLRDAAHRERLDEE